MFTVSLVLWAVPGSAQGNWFTGDKQGTLTSFFLLLNHFMNNFLIEIVV